jgi:hypothetical protein
MATPFYSTGGPTPHVVPSVLDAYMIPESELRTAGSGIELLLETYTGGLLEFTLNITRVNERASLDLTIWGSSDGQVWGARPLIQFPRKYLCGESKLLWDPADYPNVQRLRAQWQVDRWGRGDSKPLIALELHAREVPRPPAQVRAGFDR